MENKYKILIINLGSTSSKLAVSESEKIVVEKEYSHSPSELKAIETKQDSVAFRKKIVFEFLDESKTDIHSLDAIAVRGLGKSVGYKHGAYLLSPQLGDDCRNGAGGHAGLYAGTVIGDELSREYSIPAYLYDVISTDEIYQKARVCGIKDYRRKCRTHTLNGRATARKAAQQLGLDFENSTFIICHMGGGNGTMCVKNGVIVDAYSAEEGSFSPERAGRVPEDFLMDVYTNSDNSPADIKRLLKKEVGIYGHLATSDCREVEKRINEGDKKAKLVYEAMAYQLSKDIGAMASVAKGKVDAVVLTGGVAHSKMFTDMISENVSFIAKVMVMPGAMEMEALAMGITRVLNKEEGLNDYNEALKAHTLFEF